MRQIFKDVDESCLECLRFASLQVLELGEVGKCIVTEKKDFYQGTGKVANMLQLDLPHDSTATTTADDIDDDQPAEGREMLNVILVHEGSCTCGE